MQVKPCQTRPFKLENMSNKIFIDGDFSERNYSRIYDLNGQNARVKMLKEAQKRLSWIENVKRVKGYSQEEAEAAWTKIFNS